MLLGRATTIFALKKYQNIPDCIDPKKKNLLKCV